VAWAASSRSNGRQHWPACLWDGHRQPAIGLNPSHALRHMCKQWASTALRVCKGIAQAVSNNLDCLSSTYRDHINLAAAFRDPTVRGRMLCMLTPALRLQTVITASSAAETASDACYVQAGCSRCTTPRTDPYSTFCTPALQAGNTPSNKPATRSTSWFLLSSSSGSIIMATLARLQKHLAQAEDRKNRRICLSTQAVEVQKVGAGQARPGFAVACMHAYTYMQACMDVDAPKCSCRAQTCDIHMPIPALISLVTDNTVRLLLAISSCHP
jgi:hypothetical protein